MPCLFSRGEAEKAELRELLESSNSQREEYRKAAELASRRAEHLAKQLEQRLLELSELSGAAAALQQQQGRLARDNEGLAQQLVAQKQALERSAAQQEELGARLAKEAAARKQAESDLRKLHKEREYLKMRVDRMQHALSILESVMDDTLRVSQSAGGGSSEQHSKQAALAQQQQQQGGGGGGGGGVSATAAALRQSMDAASVQQLQHMIRSSRLGGDTHGCGEDQRHAMGLPPLAEARM